MEKLQFGLIGFFLLSVHYTSGCTYISPSATAPGNGTLQFPYPNIMEWINSEIVNKSCLIDSWQNGVPQFECDHPFDIDLCLLPGSYNSSNNFFNWRTFGYFLQSATVTGTKGVDISNTGIFFIVSNSSIILTELTISQSAFLYSDLVNISDSTTCNITFFIPGVIPSGPYIVCESCFIHQLQFSDGGSLINIDGMVAKNQRVRVLASNLTNSYFENCTDNSGISTAQFAVVSQTINCTFIGNEANGQALFLGTAYNSSFLHNTARYSIFDSCELVDCLVANNSAPTIFQAYWLILHRTTVMNNTATARLCHVLPLYFN
jgi:hypothetical protein